MPVHPSHDELNLGQRIKTATLYNSGRNNGTPNDSDSLRIGLMRSKQLSSVWRFSVLGSPNAVLVSIAVHFCVVSFPSWNGIGKN